MAEVHYGLRFAEHVFGVQFEPTGGRGPDLLVSKADLLLYVEVKRLLVSDPGPDHDVADWYSNENRPSAAPVGNERPTLRLLSTLRDAHAQLIPDYPNLVVIHDFSLNVTRLHFIEAARIVEGEQTKGMFSRLTAILYHPNYSQSEGPVDEWIWVSENAQFRELVRSAVGSIADTPVFV